MKELVSDCPRCGAVKITFELHSVLRVQHDPSGSIYETFGRCRSCQHTAVFVLDLPREGMEAWLAERGHEALALLHEPLSSYFAIIRPVTLADVVTPVAPDHVPAPISDLFIEGAKCTNMGCYNAAGTMFRLALDQATVPLLPPPGDPERPPGRTCDKLGLRIEWLSKNRPSNFADLLGLADCIREDGNDGAHLGTVDQATAEDLMEFTREVLERLFTFPGRVRVAEQRRVARRASREGS